MADILRHKERGASVFLATPVYEKLSPSYTASLYATRAALAEQGIASELCILAGDCHVDDARNRLFGEFLKSDCTKMVFLDADLSWRAEDFLDLISHSQIVAGVYPKRGSGGYAVRHLPGYHETNEAGLVEVAGAATGFMAIDRDVVERLATVGFTGQDGTWSPLICERTRIGQTRFGGDYELCRKWRALGGEIYINPWYRFDHAGHSGCYAAARKMETGQLIPDCLQAIRDGRETMDTLEDLRMAWGNPYTASAPFLYTAIQMAREADSVLELGSGLSTLCLAAVGPVKSLEDDPLWAQQTRQECRGLPAEVILSPLKDGWYDTGNWVADLVVCDGPNRAKGDRTRAKGLNFHKMLIDDCNPHEWPGVTMVQGRIGVLVNDMEKAA